MLIAAHHRMIRSKPYLCEVEYLESTGTQYIQTDYTPTIYHNFKAVAAMMDLGDAQLASALGTAKTTGTNGMIPLLIQNGSVSGWLIGSFVSIGGSAGEVHTITSKLIQAAGYPDYWEYSWYDSGRKLSGAYQPKSNPIVWLGKMTVFACSYDNGTVNRFSKSRFYSFSAVDVNSGEKVIDLIPVRKGTVGYLYDRVTGKLFGNAGTGDFVLGPDVVPVEYIESRSDHIQVIDTGFYANQNTKSLITFEKLGADGWLFGSRNGSSSATDKFGIFAYQSPDGKISAQVGNTYIEPIISGGLTYRKKTIELSLADGVTVDGETIATFSESQKSQTFTSTYPMALFNMRISSSGHNAGIYCRVYAYQIFENGLIARNFLPVRVGTDATSWEGAMMDVLTRRIYRNAGTGAFGYGNDTSWPTA